MKLKITIIGNLGVPQTKMVKFNKIFYDDIKVFLDALLDFLENSGITEEIKDDIISSGRWNY